VKKIIKRNYFIYVELHIWKILYYEKILLLDKYGSIWDLLAYAGFIFVGFIWLFYCCYLSVIGFSSMD